MSTPTLVAFSELWRTAPAAPAPRVRLDTTDTTDTAALLRAARRARTRYPGPVGELLAEEIAAYIAIGRRFAGPTVIGRVVAELLEE